MNKITEGVFKNPHYFIYLQSFRFVEFLLFYLLTITTKGFTSLESPTQSSLRVFSSPEFSISIWFNSVKKFIYNKSSVVLQIIFINFLSKLQLWQEYNMNKAK